MQAAVPLSENMQKKIIGMAALLLTGASVTPANLQAVQIISQKNSNMTNEVPASFDYHQELVPPERVTNPNLLNIKPKIMKVQQIKTDTHANTQVEVSQIQVGDTGGADSGVTELLPEEAGVLKNKIVASVLNWQGVPYRWGGRTRSGVDCSALVQRVYNENGISLPRTSYEQFRQGVGIAKSKLEPGDLVFFNTAGSGASHVGIYIGENNFISATKNCVEIQSLDSSYWAGNYRGSRRIIS